MSTVNGKRKEAVKKLKQAMEDLNLVEQESLESGQDRIRKAIPRETLPNFGKGDFGLGARNDF